MQSATSAKRATNMLALTGKEGITENGAYGKSDEAAQGFGPRGSLNRPLARSVGCAGGVTVSCRRKTARRAGYVAGWDLRKSRSPAWGGHRQKNFGAPLDACRLW